MKKTLLIVVLLLCFQYNAQAQGRDKATFGIYGGPTIYTSDADTAQGHFGFHLGIGLATKLTLIGEFTITMNKHFPITDLTLNGRYVFAPESKVKLFAEGGMGYYTLKAYALGIFGEGEKRFGVNIGGGVLYEILGVAQVFARVKYHNPFVKEARTNWVNISFGADYIF